MDTLKTERGELEAARLAELDRYGILDTPAEDFFDDITRIAAEVCSTPMALITFLDEGRQWFKSRLGVSVPETPRSIAFCDFTIRSQDIFEVRDARKDAGFSDNPLVTGYPHIAHYAGVPLASPNGLNVGTLCVLDREPGKLSQPQRSALSALARQVVLQLELNVALRESDRARDELQSEVTLHRKTQRLLQDAKVNLEQRVSERTRELEGTLAALTASERQFRALFEDSSFGIGMNTPAGAFIAVNTSYAAMLGYEPKALIGRNLSEILVADEWERVTELRRGLFAGESPGFVTELCFRHRDGAMVWCNTSVAVVRDADGKVLHTVAILQPVGELKRAESERDQFFNQAIELFAIVGLNGQVLRANPAAERQLGYTQTDLEKLNLFDVLHPDDVEPARTTIAGILDGRSDMPGLDARVRNKAGEFRMFRFSGSLWMEQQRLFIVGRDITEAKQAEIERELLTSRLMSIREEERKQISREIHDELGQLLTAAKIDLDLLVQDLNLQGHHSASENIRGTLEIVDKSLSSVRTIAQQLRPEVLDTLGLAAAVEWQCREIAGRAGLRCKVSIGGSLPDLAEDTEIQLFRIVQEALTNIMRHADASQVQFSLDYTGSVLQLTIRDDGRGFEVGDRRAASLGMLGMRERAKQIGAKLEVVSSPGAGAEVRLELASARKERQE